MQAKEVQREMIHFFLVLLLYIDLVIVIFKSEKIREHEGWRFVYIASMKCVEKVFQLVMLYAPFLSHWVDWRLFDRVYLSLDQFLLFIKKKTVRADEHDVGFWTIESLVILHVR